LVYRNRSDFDPALFKEQSLPDFVGFFFFSFAKKKAVKLRLTEIASLKKKNKVPPFLG
jgi:hypothetical protein